MHLSSQLLFSLLIFAIYLVEVEARGVGSGSKTKSEISNDNYLTIYGQGGSTWLQKDGKKLCRNDSDCTWVDEKSYCHTQSFELIVNEAEAEGKYIGNCECQNYATVWNDIWGCTTDKSVVAGWILVFLLTTFIAITICCSYLGEPPRSEPSHRAAPA